MNVAADEAPSGGLLRFGAKPYENSRMLKIKTVNNERFVQP
jgi:hypothetical protein